MGKLHFIYGVMGTAKSADLLITNHSLKEKGYKTVLFAPSIDNRWKNKEGECLIQSRVGIHAKAIPISGKDNLIRLFKNLPDFLSGSLTTIFIDEVQFLKEKQVDQIVTMLDAYGVDAYCYGLKTDFTSHLYGSFKKTPMSLALGMN